MDARLSDWKERWRKRGIFTCLCSVKTRKQEIMATWWFVVVVVVLQTGVFPGWMYRTVPYCMH